MENRDVARILEEIGGILEILGENAFRVRAYQLAAETVVGLGEPLERIAERMSLEELPHVGAGMAARIHELLETGRCRDHEKLLSSPEGGLLQVVKLPGIGPKRARLMLESLGVANLDDLEQAARQGKLASLPGMGPKMQQRVLRSLERRSRLSGRVRLDEADRQAERLLDILRDVPGVEIATSAGELRRRCETVRGLELLVTCRGAADPIAALADHPDVESVVSRSTVQIRTRLRGDCECVLRVIDGPEFGAALLHSTGSKDHHVELRSRARESGLELNASGVFAGGDTSSTVAGPTEEDVYAALGLPWIPPELREGRGEIEACLASELPQLLVPTDIRGDCHVHTTASDGRASLEAMVDAARARGYEYVAVTDHSPHVRVVNGLDESRLASQWAKIDKLNSQLSEFRILRGVEVDVLPDGSLDLSDGCLADADLVLAAVHSQLDMEGGSLTSRVLRAIEHPHVDALAHPTGRKLLVREPGALDLERVFKAAAEHGVMLECNASPRRLDLGDTNLRRAVAAGVRILISTDAHDVESLDWMRFGVDAARRAWLSAENVANARPLGEFLETLRPR